MKKKNKFNPEKKYIARLARKNSRLKLLASKGDVNAKYEFKMLSDILGYRINKMKCYVWTEI